MKLSGKSKRAFSLIEIIFAIVILGVIASIAVPKLMSSKTDASLSSIKQDIRTITTSIQSYYIVHGSISKFSDAINLNNTTWNIENKKVEFMENENSCVKIELLEENNKNTLNITINSQNTGTVCSKLIQDGFTNQNYELN